jgi:predicted RNA polymerase sigma factor
MAHDPSKASVLVDHLFRSRAGQMVAWLTRVFGPAHIDLAEEVVQDALVKALQQWPYSGIPDNPGGWLLAVARNGALDVLRRHTARTPSSPRSPARSVTRTSIRRPSRTTSSGWSSCAAIHRCRRTPGSP